MPLISAATGGFTGTSDGQLLHLQPVAPGPGLWSTIVDNGDGTLTLTTDDETHSGVLAYGGYGTATVNLGA